jgi:hypothetical protein
MHAEIPTKNRPRKGARVALIVLAVAIALGVIVNAVLPFRIIAAALKSKDGFVACVGDPRVLCEPGSDELATEVASHLAEAIGTIARSQFGTFSKPIVIYTYTTHASFAAHTGFSHPQAVVFNNTIHVSPEAFRDPIGPLIIHEMSHLALYQATGMWTMSGLPNWFMEGLATYVSGGAGAGRVTEEGATRRMAEGACITPRTSESRLNPLERIPAKFGTNLFYRQGAMFVAYLQSANSAAFERLLDGVVRKEPFADAVTRAYGVPLEVLWTRFLEHTRTQFNRTSATPLGRLCPPDKNPK